jgi:antitoxin ParD1/3/4
VSLVPTKVFWERKIDEKRPILGGMSVRIPAELEKKLRVRAKKEGLSIEDYLERLIGAERAEQALTALALEGIQSGEPLQVTPDYWQSKHRRLDERLKSQ